MDIYIIGLLLAMAGLFMVRFCTYPAIRIVVLFWMLRDFDHKMNYRNLYIALVLVAFSFVIFYGAIHTYNQALELPATYQWQWLDRYIVKRCIPGFILMGVLFRPKRRKGE